MCEVHDEGDLLGVAALAAAVGACHYLCNQLSAVSGQC